MNLVFKSIFMIFSLFPLEAYSSVFHFEKIPDPPHQQFSSQPRFRKGTV